MSKINIIDYLIGIVTAGKCNKDLYDEYIKLPQYDNFINALRKVNANAKG